MHNKKAAQWITQSILLVVLSGCSSEEAPDNGVQLGAANPEKATAAESVLEVGFSLIDYVWDKTDPAHKNATPGQ